jgi:predicted phosphodiesterase
VLLVSLAGAACVEPPGATRQGTLVTTTAALPAPGELALPNEPGSIKFAVIGDSGHATPGQYEVARRMAEYREKFGFDFVLMLGDNIYEGPADASDYEARFERPYDPLLRAGVEFHAVLGNHDDPRQTSYLPFNMDGHRYYAFEKSGAGGLVERRRARFVAIDTTRLDAEQRAWLERELRASEADWTICFFHHPLYTVGRYATWWRRRSLEPLLVRNGADLVFSGHEHLYARTKPQKGIQHFVSGGAGDVRVGDLLEGGVVARGYDQDLHFMLVEIAADALHFQAIGRTGRTVDAGTVRKVAGPAM